MMFEDVPVTLTSSRFLHPATKVVISESLLAKRWPEAELRALANRAISSGQRVILPVLICMDHRIRHRHRCGTAARARAQTA